MSILEMTQWLQAQQEEYPDSTPTILRHLQKERNTLLGEMRFLVTQMEDDKEGAERKDSFALSLARRKARITQINPLLGI